MAFVCGGLLLHWCGSVGAPPQICRHVLGRGSAECSRGFPLRRVREMADPAIDVLEGVVAICQDGVAVRRAGWRCSGTEERRLPGREGEPPSPRFRRWCGIYYELSTFLFVKFKVCFPHKRRPSRTRIILCFYFYFFCYY